METKKIVSKIITGVAVIGMAASTSAFTNKVETARVGIHVGVLAQGTDATGAYFDVEEFSPTGSCNPSPGEVCSFDFDASALPSGSRIYQSDPRINSLVNQSQYQP